MFDAARGLDSTAVVDKGPPKSITVEDSLKSCTSLERVVEVLRSLGPDLVTRVKEEHIKNNRWPKTFTIQWRNREKRSTRSVYSCAFPSNALSRSTTSHMVRYVLVVCLLDLIVVALG